LDADPRRRVTPASQILLKLAYFGLKVLKRTLKEKRKISRGNPGITKAPLKTLFAFFNPLIPLYN
jgi:hypothetical protein